MKSDTPRTDEAAKTQSTFGRSVTADFSRELERKNARLEAMIQNIRDLCTTNYESKADFIARVNSILSNTQEMAGEASPLSTGSGPLKRTTSCRLCGGLGGRYVGDPCWGTEGWEPCECGITPNTYGM